MVSQLIEPATHAVSSGLTSDIQSPPTRAEIGSAKSIYGPLVADNGTNRAGHLTTDANFFETPTMLLSFGLRV